MLQPLLLALATVVSVPALAAPAPSDTDAALFKQRLAQARDRQFDALAQVPADDPMRGYLDYQRLRHALPNVPVTQVQEYLQRYATLPLANSMEGLALNRYGQQGNWAAVRALRSSPPATPENACYYWRAVHDAQPQLAYDQIGTLWLSGGSRPAACDPLFAAARAAGALDDTLVLERMLLAYEQGNTNMVTYLQRQLSDDKRPLGDQLLQALARPQAVASTLDGFDPADRSRIVRVALERVAQRDTPAARALLEQLDADALQVDANAWAAARRKIAWYAVIRDLKELRGWADHVAEQDGDPDLVGQRARRAVIEQDWPGVSHWIAQLPADQRGSARWQYWQGRAAQAQGQNDVGITALRQAAAQRSFWGYAAADRLKQPYALNNHTPATAAADTLGDEPALYRVDMLQQIDEHPLARAEWGNLLRRSTPEQRATLASVALQRGWPALAVDAAIQSGEHNALEWRFPRAYRDDFQRIGRQEKVDPYLLMAVARRESSFHTHATSPAGARGLMQLMPGTAKQVAGWLSETAPSNQKLYEPALSIRYGSTYLSDLLKRYQGNRLLALAAYNAGPRRVDEWLANQSLPYDVWVESIPFYETREYVQAVLTYRVLFEMLDGQNPRQVALVTRPEQHPGYDLAQLNTDAAR
ncbi:transglycosylase SLT domain-containing protein [Isoalcanivorax beigongshangi]|uniref:Transglycosylase SLT domain-containing protein n=1 Tax=Isoalcanivorax beigongshangi TaxID=3238810 RepID=A0ABV4AI84_9GAMM